MLLLVAIVAPLLIGGLGAYSSYRAHIERAKAELVEAAAVAEENTIKVLDTHELVAARIVDTLAGLSDAQIRADERQLHDRLAEQIKHMPEVAAAWAIDANGRELVSARVFPVNPDLDQAGRDDFAVLKKTGAETFIWALRARMLDRDGYQAFFTVARRRTGPDGSFGGIAVVAVSGSYFASFYSSLLGSSAEYTASVFRDDGANLAHYPEDGAAAKAPTYKDDELVRAIAEKGTSGVVISGSEFGWKGRLVAYRRVGDYPIYVTISRTRASVLNDWLETVAGYVAIIGPAAVGFVLLTLLALRRTRREQLALAQARDAIAQRAEVESQLHQAQKMEVVGQLTAGIAHDFNNLLTAISGNIAMAQMALDGREPKIGRLIDNAVTACDRAAALVSRLLAFSRREPDDPQQIDVNEVIGGMSDLLGRSISGSIRREIRLADAPWPVFVDINQLENALLNLVLNARDAMPEGGVLTIATENRRCGETDDEVPGLAPGDYVALSVSDTGCGMPPELRDRVFEPFFTTKAAGKGTGLGLSQVYGFAQRSGGHCTIDSEPGSGTAVTIYLPRHMAEVSEPERGPVEAERAPDAA